MTKKSKKTSKPKSLTIPQLRKAFEHIDTWVKGHSGDIEGFQKIWKKTFGKEVSKKAAQDYFDFIRVNLAKDKSVKDGQSGGGQLMSPAPIGYDLRAGADIPHGSFQPYVQGGFGFANIDSLPLQCGKETGAIVPAHFGENTWRGKGGRRKTYRKKNRKQEGGGFLSTMAEAFTRPFIGASPPSYGHQAEMTFKGEGGMFPSGAPEINPRIGGQSTPYIYNASIAPTTRVF